MADPGFPTQGTGRGTPTSWFGGKNLLFGKVFALNWMKMKNLDQEGARVPIAPLDSQMVLHSMATNESVHLDTCISKVCCNIDYNGEITF